MAYYCYTSHPSRVVANAVDYACTDVSGKGHILLTGR